MGRPEEDGVIEDLLRRRAGEAQRLGGPSCGDAELLAAYSEGALSDPARGDFERHLAACGACREAVARLVRLGPREASAPAPEPARAWSTWTRWAWAAPVLAGVTLVGSFAWYEHERIVQPQSELVRVSPPAVAPAGPAAGSDVDSASRRQKAEGNRQQEPALKAPQEKDQPAPAPPARMQERSRAAGKNESGGFAPAPSQDQKEDQKKGKASLPDAESRAAAPEPKAMAQAKEEDAVSPAGAGAMNRPLAAREKTAARDESSSDEAKLQAAPQKMTLKPAADAAGRADKQAPAATLNETVVAGTLAKRAAAVTPAEGRIAQRRQVGKGQSWVLMADGRLFFSSDGGQSWRQVTTPETPQSISFQDENSGEIVARSGRKYKTTDGGKTWEEK